MMTLSLKDLRNAASHTEAAYNCYVMPLAQCAAEKPIEFDLLFREVAEKETLDDILVFNNRAVRDLALLGLLRVRLRILEQQIENAELADKP